VTTSTLETGGRLRPPVRACLALALSVPFIVAVLAASTGVAHSASAGTLTVTPSTGSALSVATFTTSGQCPAGDTVRLKVFGGSGAGATIPVPLTINSPKNLNGAQAASSFASGAGMDISASQTWSDFASTGTPVLSRLNGTYTLRAWCSSDVWFDGDITFTGTDATTATYTAVVPSPSPSTTSASPTPTTASPTPTSASPTPTTASPTPTSPSPTLTTSSPSPTATSVSPTPTLTQTPTPTPTSTGTPGGTVGQAIEGSGSFVAAGAHVVRGTTLTLVGHEFVPGEALTFSLRAPEVVYGHGSADSNGSALFQFSLPGSLPLGDHTLVMAGSSHTVVFPFVVVTADGSTSASPTPSGSASSTSRTSGSHPTGGSGDELADTGVSPTLFSFGLATALMLLVGANLVLGPSPTTAPVGRHAPPSGRTTGRHGSVRRQQGRHA
jgi:hypothetical protein